MRDTQAGEISSEGDSPVKIKSTKMKSEANLDSRNLRNSLPKQGAFRLKNLQRIDTNERSSYIPKKLYTDQRNRLIKSSYMHKSGNDIYIQSQSNLVD